MLVLGDVVVGGGLLGVELLVGDGDAGRLDGELLQGVLEPPAHPRRGGHPGGGSVAGPRFDGFGKRLN